MYKETTVKVFKLVLQLMARAHKLLLMASDQAFPGSTRVVKLKMRLIHDILWTITTSNK